jgi:hypothetical protein
MGIDRRLGALSPAFRTRLEGQRAEAGRFGPAWRVSGRPLQAAFQTSTGSSCSASRYSTPPQHGQDCVLAAAKKSA